MNQFYNPYLVNQPNYPQMQSNTLPPQQILQANGRSSVDAMRMSPNSSVLVADTTLPIVYRCISDGLGNVTVEAFDITPHVDEAKVTQDTIITTLAGVNERLNDLEVKYESIIKRSAESDAFTSEANVANNSKRKKSADALKSDDAE